MTTKD